MSQDYPSTIPQWEVFEVSVEGTQEGNPYVEQKFIGMFTNDNHTIKVNGFYDGNGIYKIRFMPQEQGKYSFILRGSFFSGTLSGVFQVTPPNDNNHGVVRVKDAYHFAYEDGTPYQSIGTTAYVWHLQDTLLKKQTIQSIVEAGFNKIRFCVFPKHYIYNFNDPANFPFEGTPMDSSILTEENFMQYNEDFSGNDFNFTVFNPAYFKNLDQAISVLARFNIEADLILFHPYDRWGFSNMGRENDLRYLEYMINRYSAYHNVWFSLANEWDLLKKSNEDWNVLGTYVMENGPYQHLRSIHNCLKRYDHHENWITHCSIQRIDLYKGAEETDVLRAEYNKPIVNDEIAYEGDIPYGWGNITGEEMIRRFYETVLRGGYPGHGEVFLNPDNVLWWSHGGTLHGESHKRMKFLKDIMEKVPGFEIAPNICEWDSVCGVPECEKELDVKSMYLFYYSFMRPSYRDYFIDEETKYHVEVIDTWNMTIQDAGVYKGHFRITLPGKQYILVRLTKTDEDVALIHSDNQNDGKEEQIPSRFQSYFDDTEETETIQDVPFPEDDIVESEEEISNTTTILPIFARNPEPVEPLVTQQQSVPNITLPKEDSLEDTNELEKTTTILPIFNHSNEEEVSSDVADVPFPDEPEIVDDVEKSVTQSEEDVENTTTIPPVFQSNVEKTVEDKESPFPSESEYLQSTLVNEDNNPSDVTEVLPVMEDTEDFEVSAFTDTEEEIPETDKTTTIFPIHPAARNVDDDDELPDIVKEHAQSEEEIDEDTGNWTILSVGSQSTDN